MSKRRGEWKIGGDVTIDERYSDNGPRRQVNGISVSEETYQANKTALLEQPTYRHPDLSPPYEEDEHMQLIVWCDNHTDEYPELEFLHHSPNGEYRPDATGKKLKAMGERPGFPDLVLPVARGGYFFWAGEMKRVGNKPKPNQEKWLTFLREQGGFAEVFYGWVEARESLIHYLRQARTIAVDGYILGR